MDLNHIGYFKRINYSSCYDLIPAHKKSGFKPPSLKGVQKSKEWIEKIRLANLGQKRTPEQRIEMSKRMIGKIRHKMPHSKETIEKLRNYKKEKNSQWKGGITQLNKSIRNLLEYKQWRSNVYKKDNWKCVGCGKMGGWDKEKKKYERLEADHIKPLAIIILENNIKTQDEAKDCKELFDLKNGRTLCKDCHKKTDTYMVKTQKIIKSYRLLPGDKLF